MMDTCIAEIDSVLKYEKVSKYVAFPNQTRSW